MYGTSSIMRGFQGSLMSWIALLPINNQVSCRLVILSKENIFRLFSRDFCNKCSSIFWIVSKFLDCYILHHLGVVSNFSKCSQRWKSSATFLIVWNFPNCFVNLYKMFWNFFIFFQNICNNKKSSTCRAKGSENI